MTSSFLARYLSRLTVSCCVMPLFFFPAHANILVQRLVSFQVFLVSLFVLIFGQGDGNTPGHTGQWYCSNALVPEQCVRFPCLP